MSLNIVKQRELLKYQWLLTEHLKEDGEGQLPDKEHRFMVPVTCTWGVGTHMFGRLETG